MAYCETDGYISVYGTHPDLQKFRYSLSNIKYRLVGASTEIFNSASSKISLNSEQIEKVKYVIIEGADINTGTKGMVFDRPFVIQIK